MSRLPASMTLPRDLGVFDLKTPLNCIPSEFDEPYKPLSPKPAGLDRCTYHLTGRCDRGQALSFQDPVKDPIEELDRAGIVTYVIAPGSII